MSRAFRTASALSHRSTGAGVVRNAMHMQRRAFTEGKDVQFSDKARAPLLAGVNKIADAVQTTLGPKGRNVAISQSYGAPKITKDGVTVAKAIDFKDEFENMGAQLIKKVASQTNDVAGDGTTTATILARSIFSEGCRVVAAGLNPMDLQRGMKAGMEKVVESLVDQAKPIESEAEIKQIATISANGDDEIGSLIAKAMEKVGSSGVITVESGNTLLDELDVVTGMKFDRGYISPIFVTDSKKMTIEYKNPSILVVDGKISDIHSILPLVEEARTNNQPLVIIAEDIEGDALNTLILNRLRAGIKVAAIKAPGFGDNRKAQLEDIAVSTGATLITEHSDLQPKDVTLKDCGSCKSLSISKDDTLIREGTGTTDAVQARVEVIRGALEASTSKYDAEKLQERLGKLSGGVAVLKVGGGSEVEVGEKKDRVEDALHATRAAVEEGIVPGGGVALLYASQVLDSVQVANSDQKSGVSILKRALQTPTRVICDNAGMEGAVVAGRLLEDAKGDTKCTRGMNAQTGEYVDMMVAGIIDPVKVVRTALSDAVSIAGTMTTTECAIADLPKTESAGPPPGMGGMGGGMGGMPGMM